MNSRVLGLLLIALAVAFLLTGCGSGVAVFDVWKLDQHGCWQVERTVRNSYTLEVIDVVTYTPLGEGVPICPGTRNAQ